MALKLVRFVRRAAWGGAAGFALYRAFALNSMVTRLLQEALRTAEAFDLPTTGEVADAVGDYRRHEVWDRLQRFDSHVRNKDREVALSDAMAPLHQRQTVAFPAEGQIRGLLLTAGVSLSQEGEAKLKDYADYVARYGASARPERAH